MLRHTFVTTSFDAGVDLRDVQIAARHADPRTTMRYDRARKNLDRHPNYILAAYMASGTRSGPGITYAATRNPGPALPNSGRCESVYLCARLYMINGRSDHQFNIVIRIGGAPIMQSGMRSLWCLLSSYRSDRSGRSAP